MNNQIPTRRSAAILTTGFVLLLGIVVTCLGSPTVLRIGSERQFAIAAVGVCCGFQIALIVCLGAWAALRQTPLSQRLPVPMTILGSMVIAELASQRISHAKQIDLGTAIGFSAAFATSYAVFTAFRACDWWLIGPSNERRRSFKLGELFVWTSVAACLLAAFSWAIHGREVVAAADGIESELFGGLLASAVSVCVVIPSIGAVLATEQRSHFIGLATVGLLSLVATALLHFTDGGMPFIVLLAATTVSATSMWLAAAYQSAGFNLIATAHPRPLPKWLVPFSGVSLAMTVLIFTTAFTPIRGEEKVLAKWREVQVLPVEHDAGMPVFVSFNRLSFGISRQAVEALKSQSSLKTIEVRNLAPSAEEIRWLTELESVETLILSGPGIKDQHLEALRFAHHLKRIQVGNNGRTKVTPDGLARLIRALPNTSITPPAE